MRRLQAWLKRIPPSIRWIALLVWVALVVWAVYAASTDRYIDTQMGVAGFAQDSTIALGDLEWRIPGQYTPIRIQDQMVALIIAANRWQRPVYFAITVPAENQAWFTPYLQMEGFAFQVVPEPRLVEVDATGEPEKTIPSVKPQAAGDADEETVPAAPEADAGEEGEPGS